MDYNPSVFTKMSYGLYVVTTWDRGKPTGCIASSAVQISSNPAMFAVSIAKSNFTGSCINQCKHFAINIISQDQDPAMINKLGFTTAKRVKKFDGIPFTLRSRLPIIDASLGYVNCKVTETIDTVSHTVYIGEVIGSEVLDVNAKPMSLSYYLEVLGGKMAPGAPSYVE